MTRKHFRIIASIISNIRDNKERERIALIACNELRTTNPFFKTGKFLTACNVER